MAYYVPTVSEIKENLKKNGAKFSCVSLFAGGGGSSTGYRMAGGNVLAICEFVPETQRTYHANWSSTHIFTEDVRKLTPEKILEVINLKKGELDILDGSPPCCAFSTQGKGSKGWGDSVKSYSDVKQSNIEDLFFEYIRIVDGLQPKCFVAENVSGMAKGDAKGYLNEVLRRLRAIGYHVECRLIDASWLGVPQKRERVIFCGVRNDLYDDSMKGRLHPKPTGKRVTCSEAFEGVINTPEDLEEVKPTKAMYGYYTSCVPGGRSPKFNSIVKAHPNKACSTITATSAANGAGVFHWDNRNFTIPELKRLMSIPDDYILTGNRSQRGERLGRMVPPLMMKAIAENLYNLVIKDTKND